MARDAQKVAAEKFYAAIGRCIAQWAQVDDELFLIFRDCLGPYEQSAIIYYRLPGLDLRFGLTDEIVRSVLPPRSEKAGAHDHADVKAWIKAKGDYQDLLAIRRRIAHHPVGLKQGAYYFDVPVGFFDVPPFLRYEISVSSHEALREKSADLLPLEINDLHKHNIGVRLLQRRLHAFLHDVLKKQHEERRRQVPPQSPR